MKILVINAGSSSLKYQLIDMTDESVICKGNCERIGDVANSLVSYKTASDKIEKLVAMPSHAEAFATIIDLMTNSELKVIDNLSDIAAVGHRVVQGGDQFSESVIVTDEILNAIDNWSDLAPLHNPAAVKALKACKTVFGADVPMAAVFDTAFHQTMPAKAYSYAIPKEYTEKYHIRKYGFHGTSHRYVTARMAELLGKPASELKIITCHLGNGSSISAVKNGKCVDTTMGFTPLDGLIMGTRAGAIDASAVLFLMDKEGLTTAQMSDLLNKKSGYLGVSRGQTSDDRDLRALANNGDADAALAGEMQRYQIKKYIGSYAAAMGGVDAILFTGGIGENSADARKAACEGLEFMGVKFDEELNETVNHGEGRISAADSKVEVWIVPTNEELLIARDTKDLISK